MKQTIYVINPNSNRTVTAGIDAAVARLRTPGGPHIECLTLDAGPFGIQTQCDVESVTIPLVQLAQTLKDKAVAVVLACFSDPGLFAVREALALPVATPVLGICESAVLTALSLGQRFGVIAIQKTSIPRHMRTFGAMGVIDRLAADLAIGMNVGDLAASDTALDRMIGAGRRLRDEHGADVLVMGCAGMATYRDPLQQALGMPVVEPSQAAVAMALGRVQLNWHGA